MLDPCSAPLDQSSVERAASLIEQADALIVAAGAGMGVDSGLPDFRGKDGFWRAYRQRTKLNVRDSDATLIFNTGVLDGGTLQTVRFAQTLGKPHLVAQLDELTQDSVVRRIRVWLTEGQFGVLNVAGPREEKRPGVYACVAAQLDACFRGSTAADADN